MKVLTATELARNLSHVLDGLERGGDEVVITRKKRPVGRLVPGAPAVPARLALRNLYGILSAEEGEAWLRDIEKANRKLDQELRDPWA